MVTALYILLHIILCVIFVFGSGKISKCNNKEYWRKCIPLIVAFTLEEGLRWGRDVDWTLYYGVYENIGKDFDIEFEFLFQFLFKTMAIAGLPYYTFITFCSFMWIFSLCYFVRPYKKCIKFFLPICLLYFTVMVSNTFRWYLAMSFFLIALRNLLDGRKGIGVIFLICTLGTHTAAFFMSMIGVVFVYTLKKRLLLKPIVVITISLVFILLFNIDSIQNYMNFFKFFSTERFDNYFNNGEQWFYSETRKGDRKNLIEYILLMVPFYIVLFSTYHLQLKKTILDGELFYSLLTVLILLRSLTSGIELLQRMSMYYEFVFVLLASYVFVFRNNIIGSTRFLLIIVVLFILYKGYIGYFKLYENEELMKYIWSSDLVSPVKARSLYKL